MLGELYIPYPDPGTRYKGSETSQLGHKCRRSGRFARNVGLGCVRVQYAFVGSSSRCCRCQALPRASLGCGVESDEMESIG